MKIKNEKTITVDTLPNDVELDKIYTEYLYSELEKSQDDIKNGRVITLEALDHEMEALYASYNNKQSKAKSK